MMKDSEPLIMEVATEITHMAAEKKSNQMILPITKAVIAIQ